MGTVARFLVGQKVIQSVLLCFGIIVFPSVVFAESPEQQFEANRVKWQDWYDQQVSERLVCQAEWKYKSGGTGRTQFLRDGSRRWATMRTPIAKADVERQSVEILNEDYMAILEKGFRDAWTLKDLIVRKVDPNRFEYEVEEPVELFESRIGSGLYYLQVPDIITGIGTVPSIDNAFLLDLNPDGYPEIRKFRSKPDQMMIKFDSAGLPTEVRVHFSNVDFNWGIKNGYEETNGRIRKVWREEYLDFKSLIDGELRSYDNRSEYTYSQLDSTHEPQFRLPHYGHSEPVIPPWWRVHQTKLLLVAVILILLSVSIFLKRKIAVSNG
jgi:hypothetical protein